MRPLRRRAKAFLRQRTCPQYLHPAAWCLYASAISVRLWSLLGPCERDYNTHLLQLCASEQVKVNVCCSRQQVGHLLRPILGSEFTVEVSWVEHKGAHLGIAFVQAQRSAAGVGAGSQGAAQARHWRQSRPFRAAADPPARYGAHGKLHQRKMHAVAATAWSATVHLAVLQTLSSQKLGSKHYYMSVQCQAGEVCACAALSVDHSTG